MSFPALANGPQYFSSGTTTTALACAPTNNPTSGNRLFIGLTVGVAATGIGITDNGSTPSGWAMVGSIVLSTTQLYVWGKISSGDETSITVSWSGATYSSVEYQEWSGAGATETPVTGSVASVASPVAFGPVPAPSNPNAVPIVFLGFRKGSTANIWSTSGAWALGSALSANDACLVAYQTTPPNTAVSGTISYTGSGPTGAAVAWLGFFLDPPGSASNSATIGGTLGALACAATMSAALAASVTAGIGANATAATTSATDAAGVTGALGSLATTAHGNGMQTAAVAGLFGGMDSSLTSAQLQALAASADFGPLSSSLTVSAITGTDTVAIDSALGALSSSLTVTAQAGVNTAAIGATLPPLGASGTVSTLASAATASAIGPLASRLVTTAVGVAQIHVSLGPLVSDLTTGTAAATLPVDENYIVTLPARAFYAALPARNFYVLDTLSMTGSFETKDPRETVVLTFDASDGLASGETLTDIASTDVTMASGTDPNAANIIANPQINTSPITVNGKMLPTGTAVQAEAVGGVNPARYLIAITCNTSNPDKVLTIKGILPVSSS